MYKLIFRRLTGQWVILNEDKMEVFSSYSQAEAQRKLCRLESGTDTIVL